MQADSKTRLETTLPGRLGEDVLKGAVGNYPAPRLYCHRNNMPQSSFDYSPSVSLFPFTPISPSVNSYFRQGTVQRPSYAASLACLILTYAQPAFDNS